MNAQELVDELRIQTYTDSSTLPDANALRYVNYSYKKLVGNSKQSNNQDLWTEIWATNSVAYQSEYQWPTTSGAFIGASNVLGVSVNYVTPIAATGTVSISSSTNTMTGVGTSFLSLIGQTVDTGSFRGVIVEAASDTSCTLDTVADATVTSSSFSTYFDNWQACKEFRMTNNDKDESWYRANGSESAPNFAVYDNSFFIYPYPKKSVTRAIKIYGIRGVLDLVLSPAPTTPVIDTDLHMAIVIGAKKYVYQMRGLLSEYQAMSVDDKNETQDLLSLTSDRNLNMRNREDPSLANYE